MFLNYLFFDLPPKFKQLNIISSRVTTLYILCLFVKPNSSSNLILLELLQSRYLETFVNKQPTFVSSKGQIISKGLLVSSNSPKEWINKFVSTTTRNSFICFFGEFEDTKKSFRNYLTFKKEQACRRLHIEGELSLKSRIKY